MIAPRGIESGGPRREFGEPPSGPSRTEHGDHVDGLGDQRARHGDHGFLDELFEPAQRAERGAGVDRADPAGMAGAPGLQQIEGFRAAHLADRDAVGPQPQRRADEIGQRGDAILGPQRHEIGGGALQLARILDQDDAVGGRSDLGQQRIGERGLAGRGAAGDEDVRARGDGGIESASAWLDDMIPAAT